MVPNSIPDVFAVDLGARLPLPGIAILLVCLVLVALARRRTDAPPAARDPQRAFPAPMRRLCFDRADGRCEYAGRLPWTRCRAAAAHADHFIPWSKGGGTTLDNAVASCARHNLRKSAAMPSRTLRRRLERQRRRAGQASPVGSWYGQRREALR